ncbi:MAG: thioredoxin domain-containing protein [Puniceicoccales bacterium]
MSNRLANESSLYLRQHAENPVDWMPWGDEAFERAKAEDKPILVSIGYSSCHWCHVMAHESFENDYIARLMNKHFVCIKVDREERPDVDRVYMEAVQMINQHGGWPLHAFCLSDGRPFYGGTYFPPEDRGQGLIPWPQLIMRISEYFHSKRDELEENAGNIIANLEHLSASAQEEGSEWSPRDLLKAIRRIVETRDPENGGFGGAPKFPPTMVMQFLLSMRQTRACGNEFPKLADKVDGAVKLTLEKIARGGLFDQVGGGFCRYCVDAQWTIPHFEKMLYDNALLIETFSIAWSRYREPLMINVVEETVDWLEREMKLPSGLYAASVDADSPEGEGKFYCWTPAQLQEILGEEVATRLGKIYRVTEEGNFEGGLSYPQFDGSLEERNEMSPARKILREERSKRPVPVRDEKELTFWNALTARALLGAGTIFEREDWILRAGEILDLLWDRHFREEKLYARSGEDSAEGFLEDYAAMAHSCLVAFGRGEIFTSQKTEEFLKRAEILGKILLNHFSNKDGSAYYFTSDRAESPLLRQIEWYDNATPSGNSLISHLWVSLATVSEDPVFQKAKDQLRPSYASLLERVPNGVAFALSAWCQDASGLVTVKANSQQALREVSAELAKRCWRPQWLMVDESLPPNVWRLCVGTTCLPDFQDPQATAETAAMASSPTH